MSLPDLFDSFEQEHRHDPGGKVKTRLPPDIVGKALFHGPKNEYRVWLSRRWGEALYMDVRYALLIGMNPSTATAEFNDPTLTRDVSFVREWGLCAFYKCNVGDYRATHPRELLNLDIRPVSEQNLPTIRALANAPKCDRIVLGYGIVPKTLTAHADELVRLLRADGHTLWCLGKTQAGHPRHPLYLPGDTPLIEF